MELLIAILGILALVGIAVLWRKMEDLRDDIFTLRSDIAKLRGHNGTVMERRTNSSTPKVDAKARTTRRDTADLPATGRMSVAVHRRKRDYDRDTDDN
jgi:hypothetical protein